MLLDREWLLIDQVKWTSGATIKTTVDTYVRYVLNKFNDSTVVCDGYGEGFSDLRVTSELTISDDR